MRKRKEVNEGEEWYMKRKVWISLHKLFGGCCILLAVSMLYACASTELEERCFPVMTAVGYEDGKVSFAAGFPRGGNSKNNNSQINEIQVPTTKGKNFEACKTKYESHLNKVADYNHLKVIVLEEELMEQTLIYEEMLDYLADTEEFPRNTYVCAVDDIEDLMKIEENLPQELGTYLEEYLNNHEDKKATLLTLGDLMDEKENKSMILYIPYLEVEESFVEWGGYYAVGMGLPPVKFE